MLGTLGSCWPSLILDSPDSFLTKLTSSHMASEGLGEGTCFSAAGSLLTLSSGCSTEAKGPRRLNLYVAHPHLDTHRSVMTHPWRVRVAATSSGWRGAEEHLSRACSRDPLPGQCLQDSRDLVRVPDAHVLCFMPTSKWGAVGIHLAGQAPSSPLLMDRVPMKQEPDQLAGASIRHFRKTALGTDPIGP